MIDFQKGNTVVSVKSVNVFTNPGWKNQIKDHVRKLNEGEITVDNKKATVQLDLRVPPGGIVEAEFLTEYGRQYGVLVEINEFK